MEQNLITELKILVKRELETSKKKVEENPIKFDYVLGEFTTSISRLGTDTLHKAIIAGVQDPNLSKQIETILSNASLELKEFKKSIKNDE